MLQISKGIGLYHINRYSGLFGQFWTEKSGESVVSDQCGFCRAAVGFNMDRWLLIKASFVIKSPSLMLHN